jgi:hypothetical protein
MRKIILLGIVRYCCAHNSTMSMPSEKELEKHRISLENMRIKAILPLGMSKQLNYQVHHHRKVDAFRIAEKYKDLKVLVILSLNDPNKLFRIRDYTERYKEEFTKVLFSTYLEKGSLCCSVSRNVL